MRLLDGSPDVWVHPIEVNYLSVFSDLLRFGRIRKMTAFNATTSKPLMLRGELNTKLLIKVFSRHIKELNENYIQNLVETFEPTGNPLHGMGLRSKFPADEFLRTFLESVRSVYDLRFSMAPKHIIFKSIETPYIEEYAKTFPEMRFIHIIRHPITNYASLKRTNMVKKGWPFWHHGGDELRMFLEKRWLPHARFITDTSATANDKHFLIRYEDLCEKPEVNIRSICQWLQISPPEDPSLQTVLGGKIMDELPSSPSQVGVRSPERVVMDMSKKFKYDEVLTIREREFIFHRTHRLAHELGYFSKEEQYIIPEKLSLVWKWFFPDKWELKGARSIFRFAKALIERRVYIFGKILFPSR